MNRLIQAYHFSAQKHTNQRRKDEDKSPYINHPIHVADILSKAGVTDMNIIIAGILHDTLEDTKCDKKELTCEFGDVVSDMVSECSDDKSLHKIKRKQLQIEHTKTASMGAQLVKLADKYSNLSDLMKNPPSKWSKEEIYGYFVWSYCVCKNVWHINDYLRDHLSFLFSNVGILKLSNEELSKALSDYYLCIDNSE